MTGIGRRELIAGAGLALAAAGTARAGQVAAGSSYGLIGKMKAVSGKRDRLVELLLQGSANMPGCLSYIVALDVSDADGIWITEVWTDEASHKASLKLPSVRAVIGEARPLIAGFEQSFTTRPVGGTGL